MKSKLALMGTSALVLATPVFAQGGNAAAAGFTDRGAAFLAMGIAAGLCGLGQARAVGSSAEAMVSC